MIEELFKHLPHNKHFKDVDLTIMKECIIRDINNNENVMFVNIPEINNKKEWPSKIQQIWNRDWSQNGRYSDDIRENWLYYVLDGTTFSGDPIHTTMGNTFRSLVYKWCDLEAIGI